jgi:hypothetical protein
VRLHIGGARSASPGFVTTRFMLRVPLTTQEPTADVLEVACGR